VLDLAALNGRLRTLTLGGWAPLEGADELAEDGPDRLRITAGPGYGSVAEPVTFSAPGATAPEMRYGGMSMRPAPALEEPEGYRLGG
jgi:hypothetical protein